MLTILVSKRFVGLAAAIAAIASLSACSDDSAGPESDTSVEDVAEVDEASDPLLGQKVTVSAEIDEIVSPQAFRLGGEELLVVSAGKDFGALGADINDDLVTDDAVMQVTGTVRELDLAAFEEEYGVDYDDEVFASLEGESVIVAQDVVTLSGEELTIAGEVSSVLDSVSFRLEGAGWQVVVVDNKKVTVEEGDFVQVTGTVRPLNIGEVEHEFGIDLDDERYAQRENDLVLLAEKVRRARPTGS